MSLGPDRLGLHVALFCALFTLQVTSGHDVYHLWLRLLLQEMGLFIICLLRKQEGGERVFSQKKN